MKKIKKFLFLSCLESTELIEKRHHFKLSFIEGFQLKIHTSRCKNCTAYERQSEFIEKGIANQLSNSKPKLDTPKLINKIIEKMNNTQN